MKRRRPKYSSNSLLDQEPFRRIYETNVVGLSLSTLDGRFLHANDETLRIIGYKRSDLEAGRLNWKVLTPLEDLAKDAVAIKEMQAVGHCAPFKKDYIRKDGSRVPVLVAFALVQENLAFGTIVDVSGERDLLAYRASPDSSLGLAVFNAVHKTNNQLNAVLMNAEMALAKCTDDERMSGHLKEIVESTKATVEVLKTLAEHAKAPTPADKVWSKRNRVYKCKTQIGVFTIAPDIAKPKSWALSIGAKILGSYASPMAAADALVGRKTGYLAWDTGEHANTPENLSGWEPV